MNHSINPLNSVKESTTAGLRLDLATNRYQQFTFSKQFERAELAKNFEQKVPSPIVTALNVTKIAPAIFFMLEKLAAAVETFLNGGVFLLNSAYSALFDHEIAVLDLPEETDSLINEIVVSFEEPTQSPARDSEISDLASQDRDLPVGDVSSTEETTNATTPKNDLDSYNDLLVDILEDDSPALPSAPSNKVPNLIIGGSITAAALGLAYVAASYFNALPDSLNFFAKSPEVVEREDGELEAPEVVERKDGEFVAPEVVELADEELDLSDNGNKSFVFDPNQAKNDFDVNSLGLVLQNISNSEQNISNSDI